MLLTCIQSCVIVRNGRFYQFYPVFPWKFRIMFTIRSWKKTRRHPKSKQTFNNLTVIFPNTCVSCDFRTTVQEKAAWIWPQWNFTAIKVTAHRKYIIKFHKTTIRRACAASEHCQIENLSEKQTTKKRKTTEHKQSISNGRRQPSKWSEWTNQARKIKKPVFLCCATINWN